MYNSASVMSSWSYRFTTSVLLIGIVAIIHPRSLSAEILPEDLSGSWRISLLDNPDAARADFDDHSWSRIEFPEDIKDQVNTQGQYIWLRRSISIDPLAGVYSLQFTKLYGDGELFLNGQKARLLAKNPDAGALYLLPVTNQTGQYTLALRLQVRPGMPVGAQGVILISDLKSGYIHYYFQDIVSTSLALLYLGAAAFLLAIGRQLHQSIYTKAAWFYFLAGIIAIGKTVFFLSALPSAVSSLLAGFLQSLSILLPLPLFFFGIEKIKTIKTSIEKIALRFALPVASIVAAVHFLLILAHFGQAARLLHHAWFLLLVPVWVTMALVSLKETARSMMVPDFILLAGFVYLFYAGITSLVSGSFFQNYYAATSPFYSPAALTPFIMLLTSMLLSERTVQRQHHQLEMIHTEMKESRLFGYIADALDTPMRATIDLFSDDMSATTKREVLTQIKGYESRLDDLLELGRLELLEEPEATVTIPALDFLQTILPGTGISHTVHVDQGLLIDTSLELVNSALIRLIHFPGFSSFNHIDLIVTEDLNERLHFRFLMHHKDRKKLRHIQDIVNERLPDSEGLWIEWKIIRETIRLLSGRLTTKTFSGRYLSLDLSLPALHLEREKDTGPAPLTLTFLHSDDQSPLPATKLTFKERIKNLLQKEIA